MSFFFELNIMNISDLDNRLNEKPIVEATLQPSISGGGWHDRNPQGIVPVAEKEQEVSSTSNIAELD